MLSKWRENSPVTVGVFAAFAVAWPNLLVSIVITFALMTMDTGKLSSLWPTLYLIALWTMTLLIVSFIAGLTCAFFWLPVIEGLNYYRWSAWVTLGIFVPTILALGLGCFLMFVGYFPCLYLFNQGMSKGLDWWPKRKWRHFLGLANDWERDEDEAKSP